MSQALHFQSYRFSRAIDVIEKNTLPKFNIGKWKTCGIAMLFRFDRPYLESNGLKQNYDGMPFYFDNAVARKYAFDALKSYFGITYDEAVYIFGGTFKAKFIFKSKKNLLSRMRKVMNKKCYKSVVYGETTHFQFA
jgi:hypothetical protein